MIRYCAVCRCNRWFTNEGDCVVCIGLFNDVILRASASATDKEPAPSCDPADICAGCRCKYNTYGATGIGKEGKS